MTETEKAVKHLCEKLSEDEDFYQGWQSNISIAFYDEFRKVSPDLISAEDLMNIANNAAGRFLDSLIYTTLSPDVEYEDDHLAETRGIQ